MTPEEESAKKYYDHQFESMMDFRKKTNFRKVSRGDESKIRGAAEKMTQMKFPTVKGIQMLGKTPWRKNT